MAIVTWVPNAGGDWDTPSDWSSGALPTSADNVIISTSTLQTITHQVGNDTVASLSVGNDVFDLDGGSLTVDGAVAMASGYIQAIAYGQTSSSLFASGTVSVTGTAQLLGGLLGGSAIFEATSTVTLANYTISGDAQLVNTNLVDETSSVTLSGGGAPSILNQAGGVFDITAGVFIDNGSTPVSSFSNAGTLEMTATNNVVSHVYVDLTSTGVISAILGSTLEIDGPSNSISGTIAGTGQVSLGGGTTTIAAGTAISVGTLGIYNTGTNVIFAGAETLTGSLSVSGTSTLTAGGNINVGGFSDVGAADILLGAYTLTVQGNTLFEQSSGSPLIAGTGKLVTLGTTTLVNNGGTALVLGGSLDWINSGSVIQNQSLQIGTASGSAAMVTNQAGAVFNVALGNIAINNGSAPVSTFSNAGTLEMTATGNATSRIYTDLASTGAINAVAGGNLEIDGPSNTISGTIAGAGQVSFGSGSTTVASKTSITVGTLAVYGTGTNITFAGAETLGGGLSVSGTSALTLGGNMTVAGSFSDVGATDILLGGQTLTLQGNALFQGYDGSPLVAGSGKLVTAGTTTVSGGGPALILGGSLAWDNVGTVSDGQSVQVGTSSGVAASIINQAHHVFDLTVSGIAVSNGSAPVSVFSNAGTLEMTATNNGTSYIQTDLVSTGVVSAVAGSNLVIEGSSNSISGTITGTGVVAFGAGTTTLAGGTKINAAALSIYNTGTALVLGGNETISGSFSLGFGSDIAIGGNTLTLSGAANFYQYYQTPLISGSGTLVTQGTTTLGGGGSPCLIIGSGVTWENTGLVSQTRNFQVGNNASQSASLVNASKAVFDLAGNVAIDNGSTPASTFSNAGTLEMTGANTTAYVDVSLASTGILSAIAGSNLELDGASNTIAGTITGAGQVSFGAGTTTLAAGTTISVGTLALYNATNLTLAGNVTVSGGFSDSNATTLTLGGYTLTLGGAAVFDQYYGTPLISGVGTLVTQGATSLGGGGTALVLGSTAVWNNAGMVTDSQSIQLGNSVSGTASLNNEKGGVFDIVVNGVTISTGSTPVSAFNNAGTLEMTVVGGGASLAANVSNTGTILAQGGDLAISGAVTGKGLLEMQSSGTLGFSNTVQSTETVKFLDTTGTLDITLPSASAFAAEITNFYAGDKIDLTNISNATGTFSAGVLTFTDNNSHAVVATLNFTGSPNFVFGNDGRGGTLITTTTQGKRGSREGSQGPTFIGPLAHETHEVEGGQLSSLRGESGTVLLADWIVESVAREIHLGATTSAFVLQDLGFETRMAVLLSHDVRGPAGIPHQWTSAFVHYL